MSESAEKRIIIIAGPNGAGKTTFALEYLPNEAGCPLFVNADLIACGLSPFAPEAVAMRAGRLMLEEIRRHVRRGVSFAFETTLAGRRYAQLIPRWRTSGYRVHLIFLRLESEELAIARVAVRVKQGGHDVPEKVIRRRFEQGMRSFEYISSRLVDSWQLYDNSGEQPQLIREGSQP
jgi:predicted ABC-type ATPase